MTEPGITIKPAPPSSCSHSLTSLRLTSRQKKYLYNCKLSFTSWSRGENKFWSHKQFKDQIRCLHAPPNVWKRWWLFDRSFLAGGFCQVTSLVHQGSGQTRPVRSCTSYSLTLWRCRKTVLEDHSKPSYSKASKKAPEGTSACLHCWQDKLELVRLRGSLLWHALAWKNFLSPMWSPYRSAARKLSSFTWRAQDLTFNDVKISQRR